MDFNKNFFSYFEICNDDYTKVNNKNQYKLWALCDEIKETYDCPCLQIVNKKNGLNIDECWDNDDYIFKFYLILRKDLKNLSEEEEEMLKDILLFIPKNDFILIKNMIEYSFSKGFFYHHLEKNKLKIEDFFKKDLIVI